MCFWTFQKHWKNSEKTTKRHVASRSKGRSVPRNDSLDNFVSVEQKIINISKNDENDEALEEGNNNNNHISMITQTKLPKLKKLKKLGEQNHEKLVEQLENDGYQDSEVSGSSSDGKKVLFLIFFLQKQTIMFQQRK